MPGQVVAFRRLRDKFQAVDALTDGDPQGVRVSYTSETFTGSLSAGRLREQVRIVREEHVPKIRGAIEEFWVGKVFGAVILSPQHFDISQTQAV